jgi:hypothetical protein
MPNSTEEGRWARAESEYAFLDEDEYEEYMECMDDCDLIRPDDENDGRLKGLLHFVECT